MYLDEIRSRQLGGEAVGIPSICSAHPDVIRETLRTTRKLGVPALIESTCNQVNQFGGYTGATPAAFASWIRDLAREMQVPPDGLILGGDHLGPSAWQYERAPEAMRKACELVQAYAAAGFTKLHLDCSMRLGDDPREGPEAEVIAARAAELACVAEGTGGGGLRYVIGTEVPPPGGAAAEGGGPGVTRCEDASASIELHRRAFHQQDLDEAWERVIALVVQPGVEFGDAFVQEYEPASALELKQFIETQALVFEAHSTDYQPAPALREMVRDHFAILKVGPALTFAYREAVFALAMIEAELFPSSEASNLLDVIERAMQARPEHWKRYYHGSPSEQALKRRYSLSDRIRYYWTEPTVQTALHKLSSNLHSRDVPVSLLTQFLPLEKDAALAHGFRFSAEAVISQRIHRQLVEYFEACHPQG